MINWPYYNRSLVRRGEILFSYDFLDSWGSEIEIMNKNKKGKNHLHSQTLSFLLSVTFDTHFTYHTDKQKVLSMLQEKGYQVIHQVMVISVRG